MAPWPNWKGYLKLSLVACPVALYPATSTCERVCSTSSIARPGIVCAPRSPTSRPASRWQTGGPRAKVYQVDKGDVRHARGRRALQRGAGREQRTTIDIESFVPSSRVDPQLTSTSRRLPCAAPTALGEEAFAVIREATRCEKATC